VLTLAIETATDLVGCALALDDAVVASFELSHGRRHAESLLPAVDACLAQVGAAIGDVGAVVADVGPGLFTGLRVGLATARSLAFALELPVAAVTSLEAMAHDARLAGRIVCAALDARRGEVFWQLFRPDPATDGVRALGLPACSPPEDLSAELRVLGEPLLLVGDALARYGTLPDDVPEAIAARDRRHPSAATVAVLGLRSLRRGDALRPDQLEPRYLRAPDAAINWTTRDGQVRA
jgi:tRNA threonylcarbamoyladenosine biosynthesis protein TsaB